MNSHEWIVLAIGFIISFIVALGVVAWFMNWVRRRGFAPFAIYRIVLGIVLIILLTPRSLDRMMQPPRRFFLTCKAACYARTSAANSTG